jgi:Tfp pilus assembly protein FimV
MSGSTDTAVPAAAPVSPSSVASLGHAWTSLPQVLQRDPFQPLVGQQGSLQSPVAIGPVPHQHVSSRKPASGTHSGTVSNPGNASGGSTATGSGHTAAGGGGNCFAHHVVRSGDSLWSIADEDLVSHGYKSVAAAVHAVYGANRATIGSDPSYLTPGERLCLPSS